MSENSKEVNEVTIKSNSRGQFEMNFDNSEKAYKGSYRNQSGCDVIEFGREDAQEAEAQVPRGQGSFMNVDGTTEVNAWGDVKHHTVQTHVTPQHNADNRFLLGTLVSKTGAPCADLRRAADRPDEYLISIAGTQTPLSNALRLGLVHIDGNGQMHENMRNIAATVNPRDPSLPGRQQAPPSETIPFSEAEFVAMDMLVKGTGLDTSALLAKALGASGTSAGKELSDVLPGTTPEQAQDLLFGVAQVRLESVAKLIEKVGGLEEGEGFNYLDRALNHMSQATKARLAHGLMVGSRAVINEVIKIGTSKDRY